MEGSANSRNKSVEKSFKSWRVVTIKSEKMTKLFSRAESYHNRLMINQ